MRERLGRGRLRGLADCFYCLSVWVAIPFAVSTALLEGTSWLEGILVWPALSGGAILLERLTTREESVGISYQEDPETNRKEL